VIQLEPKYPLVGGFRKDFKPGFCWMNGKIIDWMDANIHIDTPTSRGEVIFEGIRGYWVPEEEQLYVWFLNEHLRRLFNSAKIRRMRIPYSFDEMKSALLETIVSNEYKEDTYVQPWVFRTFKYPYYTMEVTTGCCVFATPRARKFGDKQFTGIKAGISSWLRLPDIVSPSRAKCYGNYIGNTLADIDIKASGFDAAIMLTLEGKVSEGTGDNIFIVREGKVITPSITQGILEGVTRAFILKAARDLGYDSCEREIDRSELYVADEIFLCGTGTEIVPIIRVDTVDVGERGPITEKLQRTLYDAIRGKISKYKCHLTPAY